MKQALLIIISTLLFTGCIFTPPPEQVVHWENTSPQYESIDLSATDTILSFAKEQLGVGYRYGGMSPSGFDCSGFICYVYDKGIGKKLPRTARAQSTYGDILHKEELKAGDLLFFDTSNRGHINHSGIYLGEGDFIHASSGKVYSVTISNINKGFYKRAFRWGGRVNN